MINTVTSKALLEGCLRVDIVMAHTVMARIVMASDAYVVMACIVPVTSKAMLGSYLRVLARKRFRLDHRRGLYRYGTYSYGMYSNGLYSNGLHSHGLHIYGLNSYGLHGYGLCSYGLYSYGLQSFSPRSPPRPAQTTSGHNYIRP